MAIYPIQKRTKDAKTGAVKMTTRNTGYRVAVDTKDPVTGKRTRIGDGRKYATKEEARAGEAALKERVRNGIQIGDSTKTVANLLTRWYDTKRGTVAPNTLASYEVAIRLHISPAIGRVKVRDLTHADAQRLINRWRDTPSRKRGRTEPNATGMAASTIRTSYFVLRSAYDQAVREKLVPDNPVRGVKLPKAETRNTLQVWTAAEVARFLEASLSDPLSPLWNFFVLEGMRRSEALGLRWSDLNWRDDGRVTAHVSQTVVPDNGSGKRTILVQERTKTKAGARGVLLTQETVTALCILRDRLKLQAKQAGIEWSDRQLIFQTGLGTPIHPDNIDRNQDRIMKTAGVPRLTTHQLRHTAATMMMLAGVPIKIVSEKLGHANVQITMDTYSHVLPDMQDQAAAAMDAALARGRAENARSFAEAV